MEEKTIDVNEKNTAMEEPKVLYMTFRCCDEVYGINLENVSEIIGLGQYTSIPETEDYIKGLINLRGKIIPVIDIRIRFGKEPLEYNDRTSVIVIVVKETIIGIIVDGIEGVVGITKKNTLPPPSVRDLQSQSRKYVFGIGRCDGEVKLLLDPDKLINDSEEEALINEEEVEEE